eukprot:9678176-Heterocapsa_arctica.AAC.1
MPIHKRLLAPLSIPSADCPCSPVEPANYVLLGTQLSTGECKRCTMREVPEAHDRQVQLLPDAEQCIRVGDREALTAPLTAVTGLLPSDMTPILPLG